MIKVQLRTGARPSEVLNMRMEELDTSGKVWVFRPNQHKNKWRGKKRLIPIGSESQDLLLPFLIGRKPGDYLFRSADGRREFVEQAYGKDAKTTIRNAESENKPYTIHGYTSSIQKACKTAGVTKWSPGILIVEKQHDKLKIEAPRDETGHCDIISSIVVALPVAIAILEDGGVGTTVQQETEMIPVNLAT